MSHVALACSSFSLLSARLKRATTKVAKLTPEEEELVRSQLLLHGFHCLLQHQCRSLIEHFGLPAIVVGVVGRIWLTYVAQWRTQPFHGDRTKKWGETHREVIVRRHAPGLNLTQQSIAAAAAAGGKAAASGENSSVASASRKRTRQTSDEDQDEEYAATPTKQRPVHSGSDDSSSRDILRLTPGELSMSLSMSVAPQQESRGRLPGVVV